MAPTVGQELRGSSQTGLIVVLWIAYVPLLTSACGIGNDKRWWADVWPRTGLDCGDVVVLLKRLWELIGCGGCQ